jgi:hypothetical protein
VLGNFNFIGVKKTPEILKTQANEMPQNMDRNDSPLGQLRATI